MFSSQPDEELNCFGSMLCSMIFKKNKKTFSPFFQAPDIDRCLGPPTTPLPPKNGLALSPSHFSFIFLPVPITINIIYMSFCSLIKGITPNICCLHRKPIKWLNYFESKQEKEWFRINLEINFIFLTTWWRIKLFWKHVMLHDLKTKQENFFSIFPSTRHRSLSRPPHHTPPPQIFLLLHAMFLL